MVAERDVLASVLVAVTALPGAFLHRTNTGVGVAQDGRHIRFGQVGTADITGCVRGRYVAIEVKRPGGRQSPAQRVWQAACERAGGLYVLARSADEALTALAVIP